MSIISLLSCGLQLLVSGGITTWSWLRRSQILQLATNKRCDTRRDDCHERGACTSITTAGLSAVKPITFFAILHHHWLRVLAMATWCVTADKIQSSSYYSSTCSLIRLSFPLQGLTRCHQFSASRVTQWIKILSLNSRLIETSCWQTSNVISPEIYRYRSQAADDNYSLAVPRGAMHGWSRCVLPTLVLYR